VVARAGPLYYLGEAPSQCTADLEKYLNRRTEVVDQYFSGCLGIDDYMARVESILYRYGFTGENSLAVCNMCRDEATNCLRAKVENIFGTLVFSFQSLGAVPTAGVVGMYAGLSHAPTVGPDGKERYVFFSFPHISVDEDGNAGPMARAARPGSCACGALISALNQIKEEGLSSSSTEAGYHDPLNPEFTILKQRLATRMKDEGKAPGELDLVSFTKLAERLITADLETLIAKVVKEDADYTVVTGVHIHSWTKDYNDEGPKLEYIWPVNTYTVVDGVRVDTPVSSVPPLTPRQIKILCQNEGAIPSITVAGTGKNGLSV